MVDAMMTSDAIHLRLFAAVDDESAARGVQTAVEQKLARHGPTASRPPQRYWKIHGYFEVVVELRPTGSVNAVFESLLNELGSGWNVRRLHSGGSWAVWNSEPSTSFAIPEVRWANLECIEAEGNIARG